MEGQLNQDDSILKVAVKTMKSESVLACPCGWDPYPITVGLFPMPPTRQKSRKVSSKLALSQNPRVSGQEMESTLGTSKEGI